jgi:hypothetical protein
VTCACGCGGEVVSGRVIRGHGLRTVPKEGHGRWQGGRWRSSGYVLLLVPGHQRANARGYVREHILVAEKALGRALPDGAEIHHFNEVRSDNANRNLVICQDDAYHKLLHARATALRACGNANWLRCAYCKNYDDPANLTRVPRRNRPSPQARHRKCFAEYQTQRRKSL